jgi:sporulation protein YlmC with PRC-barrel domain
MSGADGQLDLGKHVLDKELLDCRGLRAGKVDDLLLELPDTGGDGAVGAPRVRAIISGPTALSRTMPRPVQWLARAVYRLLGLPDPKPVTIPWDRVIAIDVVVHLDIDRAHEGMMALADAVNRRYIRRLPGA